jgi:hypothetical protein
MVRDNVVPTLLHQFAADLCEPILPKARNFNEYVDLSMLARSLLNPGQEVKNTFDGK